MSLRSDYPGWQYTRQSELREDVLAAWQAVSGREGKIEATHGGLECGLFIEKIPGLDAVSLGPELHDVHSVKERLNVSSTQRVYELVLEVLKRSNR
jgi:dipeptidase D